MSVEKEIKQAMEILTGDNSQGMNVLLAPEPCKFDIENLKSTIRFRAKDWQKNQRGEIHGGIITAMFDTAMGMSIMGFAHSDVATSDINVSFIRPFIGESYLFDIEVIHMGRTLVRIRGTAYDEETEKCLASATANFVHVK